MAVVRRRDLTCKEVVELVTDYLENALSAAEGRRFERHLKGCSRCVEHLEQLRTTLVILGTLREESLDPGVLRELERRLASWSS